MQHVPETENLGLARDQKLHLPERQTRVREIQRPDRIGSLCGSLCRPSFSRAASARVLRACLGPGPAARDASICGVHEPPHITIRRLDTIHRSHLCVFSPAGRPASQPPNYGHFVCPSDAKTNPFSLRSLALSPFFSSNNTSRFCLVEQYSAPSSWVVAAFVSKKKGGPRWQNECTQDTETWLRCCGS